MIVLMVEKKGWPRRRKMIFWIIFVVIILSASGFAIWRYNHEQYVAKIKAEDFTVVELSQPNNDIDKLVEKRTGKTFESWRREVLTERSFVTAQEAIYVGQALFMQDSANAKQAEKAYAAADKLGGGDQRTYLFYIDYASIAASAGDTPIIDSLENKAHEALKNNSSMSDDEKTSMDEYVTMKFKSMRGE